MKQKLTPTKMVPYEWSPPLRGDFGYQKRKYLVGSQGGFEAKSFVTWRSKTVQEENIGWLKKVKSVPLFLVKERLEEPL
jgi:hypothetical protein